MKTLPTIFLSLTLAITGIIFLESCHKNKNEHPTPTPSAFSFTPKSGAMNTPVVISGSGFSTTALDNVVTINGVATPVIAATGSSLTVNVPPHSGDGKITVTAGGKAITLTGDFKYLYTVTTLAGDGTEGFNDGAAASARFSYPGGMETDISGDVIVADVKNNRIRLINSGVVRTISGDGIAALKDGAPVSARYNYPYCLAFDAFGNLYVADAGNNRIRKISEGQVKTLAGDGTPGYKEGAGSMAEFQAPYGITADNEQNIFVADYSNNRIRKITPDGTVSTFAGGGTPGFKEGQGTAARVNYPTGLTADASKNIYVADKDNGRIRKITPAGMVSTFAGNGNPGFKDGDAATAQFLLPFSVAADPHGNIYVTDLGNHAIRKITPAGVVTTIAGNGVKGLVNGLGPDARFFEPTGIAVNSAGTVIYVSDSRNNCVRKLE